MKQVYVVFLLDDRMDPPNRWVATGPFYLVAQEGDEVLISGMGPNLHRSLHDIMSDWSRNVFNTLEEAENEATQRNHA